MNIKTICFAALGLFLMIACEKDYMAITNPETAPEGPKSYSTYEIDWVEAADSCSASFVERFFCSENRNGAEGVFSYSDYNSKGGNFNCYWQQAHAMAAMVDYYNRIKKTDPNLASEIEKNFRHWYVKKGNNYEGNQGYRGTYGFGNDFTDDTCWIIIALLQMYDATGEQEYYDAAKSTWDDCVWPRTRINQYGFLPWKWSDKGENECTNGPGSIAAAKLAAYAKDAGNMDAYEKYLEMACKCFDQNLKVMNADGTLSGIPLSYTQGTCMEAGRLIWKLTGETGYLRKGILAARGQMKSGSMNTTYNNEKVMRDEGQDENNAIFKAVFFHWAARMAADTEIDSFDPRIRKELYDYINRHASLYWTKGIDKAEGRWEKSNFSTLCYEPRGINAGGSLGAYSSAAQCIESMCMLRKAKFPSVTLTGEGSTDNTLTKPSRIYMPRQGYNANTVYGLNVVFEWESSKAGTVVYQILFDLPEGDFSNPIFIQSSDNTGFKPFATIDAKTMDVIATIAGAAPGETVQVKWTVKTFQGLNSILGVKEGDRVINITRANI